MTEWLTAAARGRGRAMTEFGYRPTANMQYWYADVAYLPHEDWARMRSDEYLVYAPPLIIEVLSPSNRPTKIRKQRLAAFAGGTREFWVMDHVKRTIEVSLPGKPSRIYAADEPVPVSVLPGASLRFSEVLPD